MRLNTSVVPSGSFILDQLIDALDGFSRNRRRNSLELFIENRIDIPFNGQIIIPSFLLLLLCLPEIFNLQTLVMLENTLTHFGNLFTGQFVHHLRFRRQIQRVMADIASGNSILIFVFLYLFSRDRVAENVFPCQGINQLVGYFNQGGYFRAALAV